MKVEKPRLGSPEGGKLRPKGKCRGTQALIRVRFKGGFDEQYPSGRAKLWAWAFRSVGRKWIAATVGLILCPVALVITPLSASPQKDRVELYYGITRSNYLIGNLTGAGRGVEQILRINPDYIPAIILKARIQMDQNQWDPALETMEQALLLEPDNVEYALLRVRILEKINRAKDPTSPTEKAIVQSTQDTQNAETAHSFPALPQVAEGEGSSAAKLIHEIDSEDLDAEASPNSRRTGRIYPEKASKHPASDKYEEALLAVDQAIAVDKNKTGIEPLKQRTKLRMMRARLLVALGRSEEAISGLEALNREQPEHFEAMITLASIYVSMGRWESLKPRIPVIARHPHLQDVALYFEGRVMLAQKRVGTARAKFEAAAKQLLSDADPLRPILEFYQGLCLQKLNRVQVAKERILRALDLGFRPESVEEALQVSRILLQEDRSEEVIPLLEAIGLNGSTPDAEVWAMLGRAHLANDTITLAISAFNESLKLDSEQPETLALRASLLRKMGELESALNDYKDAQRLLPSNPVLSYEKGLVLLALGRVGEAEISLRVAARKLPGHNVLDLLHATCACTIGKPELAKKSLYEYLAEVPDTREPGAHYLARLLGVDLQSDFRDPLTDYFDGPTDRKTVFYWAGTAETYEQAQKQMCTAAFWMAQHEKASGEHAKSVELLKIALKTGNSNWVEYQLADWLLQHYPSHPSGVF